MASYVLVHGAIHGAWCWERLIPHLSPVSRGLDLETMFCNDLDEETSEWLLANLGTEPPRPMIEAIQPVEVELELPAVYILCQHDESLPPEIQREQARNAGVAQVVPFDSGHSAFASKPRELAELLLSLE